MPNLLCSSSTFERRSYVRWWCPRQVLLLWLMSMSHKNLSRHLYRMCVCVFII